MRTHPWAKFCQLQNQTTESLGFFYEGSPQSKVYYKECLRPDLVRSKPFQKTILTRKKNFFFFFFHSLSFQKEDGNGDGDGRVKQTPDVLDVSSVHESSKETLSISRLVRMFVNPF